MPLTDRFNHRVDYMRISVTDRCNERCLYCLPHEQVAWLPRGEILAFEEILRVARVAAGLGIVKFRITGGEPLVRRDVVPFIGGLNEIPGVSDIGLTTNATLLAPLAERLRANGVRRLNVSMDTLRPDRYAAISQRAMLREAVEGLDAARAAGFPQIKLNMVLMRGKNDDEVLEMIEFAREKSVVLRFIEMMPVSTTEVLTEANFMPVGEVMRLVRARHGELASEPGCQGNGPATYYTVPGLACRDGRPLLIGFIGALTNRHFCETCNKIRLTSDGKLRPCLGSHGEFDLKRVLRQPDATDTALRAVFMETIAGKPEQHEFRDNYQPGRRMTAIGG
ncbi:MAG: GTP 3',8-cyclase MoaA [Verrucomicrobia bacterium]|nr:GTP 3',8-cyclase MoaA [Verrucomicrobiota bacterium]